MNDYISVIKCIKLLLKTHLEQISIILKSRSLISITNNYKKQNYVKPFNIILAASDIYYYENYHSDIIVYILENGKNALKHFLNYLNILSNVRININNYYNTKIVREKNKIDILIDDLSSNHCIIIENKINNAGDMRRQLPKYYETLLEKNKNVDCIVYISLDGKKYPDKSTWKDEDLQLCLEKKIILGAAANGTEKDFVNAFLIPCMNDTKDEHELAFYKQYIDLLNYLRRNQMDYQLMEKFYNEMLNAEHYNSVLSIREMINNFSKFRRDRIRDKFLYNHGPFEKQSDYINAVIYEFIRDISSEEKIKLDIWSEEKQTVVFFWIQEPKIENDLIKEILQKIGEENNFVKKDINNYYKIFKFPEEEEMLYKYMNNFFYLLNENKNKINIKKDVFVNSEPL